MIRTFEKFIENTYTEHTLENPNRKVFTNLDSNLKSWIEKFMTFNLIKRVGRSTSSNEDKLMIWTKDGKLREFVLVEYTRPVYKKDINIKDKYWDDDLRAELKQIVKSNTKNMLEDPKQDIKSTSVYMKLMDLGLNDVTTERQLQNGTLQFESTRTYKRTFSNTFDRVQYYVYARGLAMVKQGHASMPITKPIEIKRWQDYLTLLNAIYEYEKRYLKTEESFIVKEDQDIPDDILKLFSREDQLAYALENHPDHDFYIFVGRPGYKDVVVNNKKYKEETLEIETLVKIENSDDAKQAGMMKIRAMHQGGDSKVYGIWLPKGVFDEEEKYVYGSQIPEFLIPLIDQHKKKI